jgi:hypothetical protein
MEKVIGGCKNKEVGGIVGFSRSNVNVTPGNKTFQHLFHGNKNGEIMG